jgi:hypothetical protein
MEMLGGGKRGEAGGEGGSTEGPSAPEVEGVPEAGDVSDLPF